ncbi:hypothetical protein [Ignatzschineria sp. LJL83]
MFDFIIKKILFKRKTGTFIAFLWLIISFYIEYKNQSSPLAQNIFSSSGAIFTIVGLFLTIKATTIFHINTIKNKFEKVDGKPVTFSKGFTEDVMKEYIKPIEKDEVWGFSLIVTGTLIWGYGSFLFIIFSTTIDCVISRLTS